MVAVLDHVAQALGHIVAQIVKAELIIGAIGNVGPVGGLPRHRF